MRVLDIFVVIIGGVVALQIFHEIIKNFDVWWALMIKKFNIIRVKRVYELVERLLDVKIIRLKWVYILKFNRNKRLSKKKTRIITQGFIQI